jgi:hexosaminidase
MADGSCELPGGIDLRRGPEIARQVNPALLSKPESYRLLIEKQGVTLIGADEAGLFYGACTLSQIALTAGQLRSGKLVLPACRIEDWPDFAHRGVMLDVSRDKVPTMATLLELVDMLAAWKVNQLQLYMEHTFAYEGHETVWAKASPFTKSEILALDAFCRERFVELVPNQNSFGHMQRWVNHDRYRALAECPSGFEHAWNPKREPYGLCPTDPASLALLSDLYDQLLPNFTSRQFNVGMDETIDLGLGRSKEACEKKGTERVYVDFLKEVNQLVRARGRTMQFWGDIIMHRPELIGELPRDVVAMEWGYEADHPFTDHGRKFADSGLSFYVVPGTSSWNTVAGRTENAIGNLCSAARSGMESGAIGYLNTDWGDNGHIQPLPVSYLGFLLGAGVSWNASVAANPGAVDLAALLDVHAFRDGAGVMGRIACDLGNAYLQTGSKVHNVSALFALVVFPDQTLPSGQTAGITKAHLEKTLVYIDEVTRPLGEARMERADASLIVDELGWAKDVLTFACHFGIARLEAGEGAKVSTIPEAKRADLAQRLAPLITRHREIWLRRNRPGGLDDSAARLEHTLLLLRAGLST